LQPGGVKHDMCDGLSHINEYNAQHEDRKTPKNTPSIEEEAENVQLNTFEEDVADAGAQIHQMKVTLRRSSHSNRKRAVRSKN
jgi:hypothetical protein